MAILVLSCVVVDVYLFFPCSLPCVFVAKCTFASEYASLLAVDFYSTLMCLFSVTFDGSGGAAVRPSGQEQIQHGSAVPSLAHAGEFVLMLFIVYKSFQLLHLCFLAVHLCVYQF